MEFSEDPVPQRKEKVAVYARRITMSAFQLTPDMSMEQNEYAMRVYERLKFDIECLSTRRRHPPTDATHAGR